MLRLLLFLSALSWLKFAAAEFEETIKLKQSYLMYYGERYQTLYLKSTADRLIICFTGKHDSVSDQDCIFAPPLTSDYTNVEESKYLGSIEGEMFKTNLASIPETENAACSLKFKGDSQGDYMLHFAIYLPQMVLAYKTPEEGTIEFMVHDDIVDTVNSSDSFQYMDISGCRGQEGNMSKPNTVLSRDMNTCHAMICDSNANIENVYCDTDLDRCQSNGICILDPVCTVIGSSIISVEGYVGSVDNHCPHYLMKDTPIQNLEVLGYFRERRRSDVYFLDKVVLIYGSEQATISLTQGSRVWIDGVEQLDIASTPGTFAGVELSKTEAGVTARVSEEEYTVTVFFDDYTAQISLTGEVGGGYLSGLCYQPSPADDHKVHSLSVEGCDKEYPEDNAAENNSTTIHERCALLRSEHFRGCSAHILPGPFFEACIKSLEKYPEGDHLECQFFETYARICSERSGETPENWRQNTNCPFHRTLCQGRTCGNNEFCAETASGDTGCFCRAIFASSYRSNETWGYPMVCDQDSGSITLIGCFLEENGIDYSALKLKGDNCEGEIDQEAHEVTFSFDSSNTCGTEVKTNSSHMIFENAIINQESSIITRDDPVEIEISCAYPLPQDQTVGLKIKDNSVTKQITTGAWTYQLTMNAYNDEHLTQALSSGEEIDLNDRIWVELSADGLGGGLATLVTDSCWATNQESPDGDPRHDLFEKGCANTADPTVMVYGNGLGASNHFSFSMFQFTGLSGDIYLHCKVNLCTKINRKCAPDCDQDRRRRRSPRFKYTDETSAFISLVWTQ